MRSPDSDDHLAAYFRQLAEHELLTPEDERELSQGIEDTEILTWERVFVAPDVVRPVLALVEPEPRAAEGVPEAREVRRGHVEVEEGAQGHEARQEARGRGQGGRARAARARSRSRSHRRGRARAVSRARGCDRRHGDVVGRGRREGLPARTSTTFVRRIAMLRTCATSSCARTCVSSSRWRAATTVVACRSPT